MSTAEPAREATTLPDPIEKNNRKLLPLLIEKWDLSPKTWVLQAISNCVLGESEGYQKNVYRHLIRRVLDPMRVEPSARIESLLMLSDWFKGQSPYKKATRKEVGRKWWAVEFPHFNLVGRGNRPRTVLHSKWDTAKKKKRMPVKVKTK
jgi:hypothetical protein